MINEVCKFIVGFKIWDGMFIGVLVILCKECMYLFLECLIYIILFCICDFCGVSVECFDGCGNYNLGLKD